MDTLWAIVLRYEMLMSKSGKLPLSWRLSLMVGFEQCLMDGLSISVGNKLGLCSQMWDPSRQLKSEKDSLQKKQSAV